MAIVFVATEGCSWRAIDQPHLSWNTVYQYFRRWCEQGVWDRLLEVLQPPMCKKAIIDSTQVKVRQSGSNPAGGQRAQGMGRTRGGLNTKVHAVLSPASGAVMGLKITPGNDSDIEHAAEVLQDVITQKVIADKGYDSDDLRAHLALRGTATAIPGRRNRKRPIRLDSKSYRKRFAVENLFQKLKSFRRVGTRYDKLAVTFAGFVVLSLFFNAHR